MATISLEYIAPALWKSGPRKRARWTAVSCHTIIDIPVLSASEAPVAIEVQTNPTLEHDQNQPEFDGRSCLLQWRTQPDGGLLADVAKTECRPSYPVPWKGNDDRLEANGPPSVVLSRYDHAAGTMTFGPQRAKTCRRPMPECELAKGIVVEDRREEAKQAALQALKGVAFVDGKGLHVPVPEPVLLVASHAQSDHRRRDGYKFVGSCVAIECYPDERHHDPVHRNFAGSLRENAKQIFPIDRMDDAITAASTDWRALDRWVPPIPELREAPICDRIRIAPNYAPQAAWLSRTFALTERRAQMDALFREDHCELLGLIGTAKAAAIRYETTGESWDELIKATQAVVAHDGSYAHVVRTLERHARTQEEAAQLHIR